MKYYIKRIGIVALTALGIYSSASALTVTYTATGLNTSGSQVNAQAIFTTGAGTVNVTVNNLLSNPNDVTQLISDLNFTLSSGSTTTAVLGANTGTELAVNSGGTYTVGSTATTGWSLTSPTASSLYLNVLGTQTGPEHLIIGGSSNGTYSGGTYSNANGSIAGNQPHNPFLESGTTFAISGLTGVTANTTITSATFSFGTVAGITAPGVPGTPAPGAVPDGGTTLLLLGVALTGLAALQRVIKR
jgi:hypothetical protein